MTRYIPASIGGHRDGVQTVIDGGSNEIEGWWDKWWPHGGDNGLLKGWGG